VILLWLTVSLAISSIAKQTARAEEDLPYPSGSAVFYSSTYNMTEDELEAVQDVIDFMDVCFDLNDYPCYNFSGSNTQRETVLGNASAMEENYHRVAMFHHGHGGLDKRYGELHYDYFDDDGWEEEGDQIWDYDVYNETGLGKHFFVVIWACWQGDLI
jgi:hypothetical protein